MPMKAAVFTEDKYLFQKIKLLLGSDIFFEGEDPLLCDILLTDTTPPAAFKGRVVRMSRKEDCDLKIPFSEEELKRALFNDNNSPLLSLGKKCAVLRGERIALTELEFLLLGALVGAGGEFVSRERLLSLVFGDGCSQSMLNVYIHYLREKLEKNREKIIISSRKYGYKISEGYLVEC